jgi:N-acetylmuramoyl-L-alanine amidase
MRKLFAAFMAAMAACAPPAEAKPASIALTLMAITAYYEARGDGVHGMRAVCHVIKNRMRARPGSTIASVVLEPAQFSVWNRGGPARRKTPRPNDPAFKEALEVARMVMLGEVWDFTQGALYFHERSIKPSWTKKMRVTAVVGRHVYYRAR